MVLHDTGADDPLRILALWHRDLLQHISDEEWFGDGTFDRVPQQFFQEYTIPSGQQLSSIQKLLAAQQNRENNRANFSNCSAACPGCASKLNAPAFWNRYSNVSLLLPPLSTSHAIPPAARQQSIGLAQSHYQTSQWNQLPLEKCTNYIRASGQEALYSNFCLTSIGLAQTDVCSSTSLSEDTSPCFQALGHHCLSTKSKSCQSYCQRSHQNANVVVTLGVGLSLWCRDWIRMVKVADVTASVLLNIMVQPIHGQWPWTYRCWLRDQ